MPKHCTEIGVFWLDTVLVLHLLFVQSLRICTCGYLHCSNCDEQGFCSWAALGDGPFLSLFPASCTMFFLISSWFSYLTLVCELTAHIAVIPLNFSCPSRKAARVQCWPQLTWQPQVFCWQGRSWLWSEMLFAVFSLSSWIWIYPER